MYRGSATASRGNVFPSVFDRRPPPLSCLVFVAGRIATHHLCHKRDSFLDARAVLADEAIQQELVQRAQRHPCHRPSRGW